MKRAVRLTEFKLAAILLILLAASLLGGCGGGGASPASPVLADSFRTDASRNVAIRADALNREFLLQGNMITLDTAQQFSGLKSRVVVFQKQAGKLFMLESQVGHTVMPDTPFAIILAEFPIIAEENGWIFFDFNQGMSQIFTTAEMYASDSDGTGYQPSFTIAKVRSCFLSEADAGRLNRLSLRQSAQVEGSNNTLQNVEVRYYLSPYLPDPSFKPTESPGFDHAGYFEVMPQLESGGTTRVLAMKWNLNRKPITYHISSNTPQEYRQAIRDGVLYWNRTLGQEIFAVADAPAGVTAPDMDRNIIQWVDYQTAGSAYADVQTDPRTGEILHAQIFLPSVFAVSSKQRAWLFLKIAEQASAPSSASLVSLRNLYSPRTCDFPAHAQMVKNVTALLAANATDEMILKASRAYVQESLTHEVGHTMGLRHNFAGTLYANHDGHTREHLYENFLKSGPYLKVLPSSSVMDYHNAIESALVVDRYNREQLPLPHDISAMRFLYLDKPLDKTIPFCTDSDTDAEMIDCRRFDYGNSPLEYAAASLKANLSVDVLPATFYLGLAASVLDGKALASLHPSPSKRAEALLQDKSLLLAAFTRQGFYSRTLKQYYPGTLLKNADQTELRKAVIPLVRADLEAWFLKNSFGQHTVPDMFMTVDPAWKDAWIARFNQITEDPTFYTIVDADGKTITFTPAEREQLRDIAKTFFTDLIPALAAADVKLLAGTTAKIDVVDGTAGEGLLAAMNATSRGYLLARTGETLSALVNGVQLSLPLFRYDWPVRLDASRLLNNRTVSSALWWGVRETAANKASLTELLDTAVLPTGSKFSAKETPGYFSAASNAAYQWYLENAVSFFEAAK
ncbi:MAG: zinc metalloprotease [Syntrophales bacterium]